MVLRVIRKSLLEGAETAEGLAVIIDVFRAFSCAPLFFHFGAERVILEADAEAAKSLKRSNPSYILVGEIDEIPLEGADLTNSPTQILKKRRAFFQGRTVIHRTTAGVAGVRAAWNAGADVVLGSFVMARAIAQYVMASGAETATLIAMGSRGVTGSEEDEACADYLEYLLSGSPYDQVSHLKDIIFDEICMRFTRGNVPYLPPEDPIFCLQRDLFDFVIKVEKENGLLLARQINLPNPH